MLTCSIEQVPFVMGMALQPHGESCKPSLADHAAICLKAERPHLL